MNDSKWQDVQAWDYVINGEDWIMLKQNFAFYK